MEAWREELYHHGILGQKWGKQNGPPYPLKPGKHSAAEKKAKKGGFKNPFKEAKRKKQRAANLEKARKAKAANAEARRKQAEHDAKRDEVIRSSTSAKELLEYKNEMTAQQMQEAINRINNVNTLKQLSQKEVKTGWDRVDKVMNKLDKITTYAEKGTRAYNMAAKVINSFADTELPIIGAEKKKSTNGEKKQSSGGTAEEIRQEQLKQQKIKTKSDELDLKEKKRKLKEAKRARKVGNAS